MKRLLLQSLLGVGGGILGAMVYNHYFLSPPLFSDQGQSNAETPIYQTRYDSNRQAVLPVENETFVRASALATPSVVYIKTYYEGRQSVDFWDFFFGFGGQQGNIEISSGSGIIVSQDGYILTNHHVIEGAQTIEVIHGKNSYQAQLVGSDPSVDLAVLKVNAQNLPAIRWGRSLDVQIGEWVLAVGNPFNLTSTVTAGIVSAKGRRLQLNRGQFPIETFIQTDAPINPGNSGGALVNLQGELIGVNTAIYSKHGSYVGYGFAVPSDIARRVYEDIRQHGFVQKAVLGAELEELSAEVVRQLSFPANEGILIKNVWKNSPAEQAGLRPNDIIVRIDDYPIRNLADYEEFMSTVYPGQKVTLYYLRGGKSQQQSVSLVNLDGKTGVYRPEYYYSDYLRAELERLPLLEAQRYQISGGVRLKSDRGNIFRRFGIEEGSILLRINNIEIEKAEEVEKIIRRIQGVIIIDYIDPRGRFYRVQMR